MNSVLADKKTVLILLGPALLCYTLVKLVPVIWSFGLSFFEGNMRGFDFIGLGNFVALFSDVELGNAILFSLKYSVVMTVGQVLLGYLLALFYVFVLRRSSAFVRAIIFFPTVLPTVAVALLFTRLFEVAPQTGPVNAALNLFGISSIDWLSQPDTSFLVIVIMELWGSMGFFAVLLYAGLLDIPEELLESARLDGANGWQLVRRIILPLSAPVLLSAVIFSFNGTLKVFDSVFALTNGGPGTSTQPLTLYMYKTTFTFQDYGYGSTLAVVLTVMCLVVTLVIFGPARKDRTEA
ncbi:carbohydrate ABC transporter permease [Microlunatus parietis]|uniref:Multiple sugar transport system permease protein/raffinose/stachyose/melibiose transport system permease protein n=1 Tax=Microlunatus parietis TaxID=682979 RepID=A0A7Y9I6F8_9ACTN|nr:sugar ABC transporter permease [Microlunatus parietis]NYE71154.1 multiple sugar transport system permease protein/raffinose/stachyose/melibiose transport system permease protein [Microlunatus parietis]